MLYKKTVPSDALAYLKQLMSDETLQNFILVGGTALSLQIGHRMSIDLDLFSKEPFDVQKVRRPIENTLGCGQKSRQRNKIINIREKT